MSRYRGPKLKILRRLGILPGFTLKRSQHNYPPGQHGLSIKQGLGKIKKKQFSNYYLRLKEKQKLRYTYGISEKQLYNYIKKVHSLNGIPGTLLLQFLEMRLDTIIYNLGFAVSISNARQFITHGHIDINKKNINIPSFQCKPNDTISINYNSNLISFIKKNLKIRNYLELPKYLKLDKKKIIGIVKSIIERQEINLNIQELLVVEFYSKK